ncbi:MAG: acyl transferase [Cyclobacteriaceae bacterium]
MQFAESFKETIFTVNEQNFESYCLEVFQYQYAECQVYQKYCNLVQKNPNSITGISQIPFLPIEFFKSNQIKSGNWHEQKVFRSSGTTQTGRSEHYVKDLDFYHRISKKAFEDHFETLDSLQILALLPSYQEMGDSSLIAMVDHFISLSNEDSGYVLNDSDKLPNELVTTKNQKLLLGVSYALLDLADKHPTSVENVQIMETGGMKGRRNEMTRAELHEKLKDAFKVQEIFSEYGMTELMSQAYGKNGDFRFPDWVKVLIRDINDPFCYLGNEKTGGINVIDLANVDSCSFIETKDLGKSQNRTFEVLGRFDNSDVRGCNLMF